MLRAAIPICCAVLTAVGAPAQTRAFAHNKLEFSNWWVANREDRFPNFTKTSGNVAGDGLFKVFPAEVLGRGGDHEITGYQLAISVDDAYTGAFPVDVDVPGVRFYRTVERTIQGQSYETIDLSRPLSDAFNPVRVQLPTDGAWVVEVRFAPDARDPKLRTPVRVPARVGGERAGIAVLVLAEPGARRDPAKPGVVMQASFQERHLAPGRPSYSGSYDAARKAVAMYGQRGQPSATGELYVGLRFGQPTLQVFGDSSGGLRNDPQRFETHMGPGAYATDLASRSRAGFFGLFVQGQQFDPGNSAPTHRALPFVVATSPAGPSTTLVLNGVEMRFRPGDSVHLGFLVDLGLHGMLQTYRPGGHAGFDEAQPGAWASPRVTIPPSPSLFGIQLWIQALVVDNALQPAAATNVVRMTLR